MKRFRFYGQEEEEEAVMESLNLAEVLMLLSTGGAVVAGGEVAATRVFECKTCRRQFPSFQALGGHRASHKKPRLGGDGPDRAHAGPTKPRVHECSVCGLGFAIGQALGGHMRRHQATAGVNEKERRRPVQNTIGDRLDLNLMPPLEAGEEIPRLPKLFGFALPTLDCLYYQGQCYKQS